MNGSQSSFVFKRFNTQKFMKFHIITIFPQILDSYFSCSIIKRARERKLIDIQTHNLRDFSNDKHRKVDDTPYGGGAGMILKIEPIHRCVQFIKSKIKNNQSKSRCRTVLFSAKGKKYSQKEAARLAKYENLILICGRYEGVDERVARHVADEEISVGEYVLTGGEIPAMILVDSITRLIPGVLGNAKSVEDDSHSRKGYLEFPQYTKPEVYNQWRAPKILLTGNHGKIAKWRKSKSKLER